MGVARFQEISLEQWRAFARQHPPLTFHAGPAWALALQAQHPQLQAAPHLLRLRSGETLLVPLMRERARLGWRCFSGVPQDGHNMLQTADGRPADGALLYSALDQLARLGLDHLTFNFSPALDVRLPKGWQAQYFDTALLDLNTGVATCIGRMGAATRRIAQRAERSGINCVRRTDTAAIDELFALEPERWVNTVSLIDQRFLQILMQEAPGDVEIWFACQGERPLASAVMLHGSLESYCALTAVKSGRQPIEAFTVLHMEIVKATASRGVRWCNGGASDGLPQVRRYKDALGMAAVPYARVTFESKRFKLYSDLRRLGRRTAESAASARRAAASLLP